MQGAYMREGLYAGGLLFVILRYAMKDSLLTGMVY